jgi:hypothetical protein
LGNGQKTTVFGSILRFSCARDCYKSIRKTVHSGTLFLLSGVGAKSPNLPAHIVGVDSLSLAKTLAGRRINNLQQSFQSLVWYDCVPCSSLLFLWIGALIRNFGNRGNLVLENLVLRQQLAVLKRRHPRPRLDLLDKLFWVAVRRFWSGWQQSLIVVTPETVVRWHWGGFRLYWRVISKVRRTVGRRTTSKEVRELIFRMPLRTQRGERHASMASFSCSVLMSLSERSLVG